MGERRKEKGRRNAVNLRLARVYGFVRRLWTEIRWKEKKKEIEREAKSGGGEILQDPLPPHPWPLAETKTSDKEQKGDEAVLPSHNGTKVHLSREEKRPTASLLARTEEKRERAADIYSVNRQADGQTMMLAVYDEQKRLLRKHSTRT